MRRAFRRAAWAGGATLVVAIALMAVFPMKAGTLPPGFRTPIVAFELATSQAEIEAMFAEAGSAERAHLVSRMNAGNYADFVFMVAYWNFLALFALAMSTVGARATWVPRMLAQAAAIFDGLENFQLLSITKALGGDYTAALQRLRTFTWIKWEAIALALVLLSPQLIRGAAGTVGRVVGGICAFSGLLGALAFVDRTHFAEHFSLTLSLGFIGLWVVALRLARAG